MKDIALDMTTGDLDWNGGSMAMALRGEWLRQKVKLVLGLNQGEWFLNITEGIPYINEIFEKTTGFSTVLSIFRDALSAIPGVTDIENMTFDGTGRQLSIRAVLRYNGLIIETTTVITS